MAKNINRVSGLAAALVLSLFTLPALSQPVYSTEFLTQVLW